MVVIKKKQKKLPLPIQDISKVRLGVRFLSPSKWESELKLKEMYLTPHFRKRTLERTPYQDCESLLYDVEVHKESMIHLTKNSPQLEWFPFLKNRFHKYPWSALLVLESLNLCLVTDGVNLITVYNLYNY